MSDADRKIALASDREPEKISQDDVETPANDSLLDHMIRRPTEADFADVLTPEGNSGDIFGSDISDSTGVNNGSLDGAG